MNSESVRQYLGASGLAVSLALPCAVAHAQEQSPGGSGGDLRAATQNRLSSMHSLLFKFVLDNGATRR